MGQSINCCGDTRTGDKKDKRPLARFKKPMSVRDAKEMTGDSGDVDDVNLEDREEEKENLDFSVLKSNDLTSEK
jgi:hypothetical protein